MASAVLVLVIVLTITAFAAGYDVLDPNGNITINWDLLSWTPDGYVAVVSVKNNQRLRPITNPGWELGWTWSGREVIWATWGGRPTHQGDCSLFMGNVPSSCVHQPILVDVSPTTPYSHQISNCCKSGVLTPMAQDSGNSLAQFQISVGQAGTTNKTVKLPKNFTLLGPGPGYTCGPAKIIQPTTFSTPDGLRKIQALMTFRVVCMYSTFLTRKQQPSCCLSLWSKLHDKFTHCPSTSPVHVRWRLNLISKHYLGAEISISNSNNHKSIKPWNLVMLYPILNNLTRVSSDFNFKPFTWDAFRDIGILLYGKRNKNDVLKAGGWVRMELQMPRHKRSFKFINDALKVYFNGNQCKLPHVHN